MTKDNGTPPSGAEIDPELITICAWTRTVRFESEWMSVERYLERRYGVRTSHGISPSAHALLEEEARLRLVPPDESSREVASARENPRRLAAVTATGLLDGPSTDGFDRITRLGASVLGVQATFISLVDDHRDFYLSNFGFGAPLASTRQLTGQTFCHFTIAAEVPLVIPGTRADPVYRNVPTVESLGVAAYLGAPLVLLSGEVIGAFCAIDFVARPWTDAQIQHAVDLASLVISEIELRQSAIDTHRSSE